MGEKRDTYGAFVPEYIINSYDWYVLHGPVHEAGIRIGGKSLRMDETDTERESKLIFWFVNCGLVRSQTLEKVLNCGAKPGRRNVPHIEKCSPIRSTNLHIIHLAMTMNGLDRWKK